MWLGNRDEISGLSHLPLVSATYAGYIDNAIVLVRNTQVFWIRCIYIYSYSVYHGVYIHETLFSTFACIQTKAGDTFGVTFKPKSMDYL